MDMTISDLRYNIDIHSPNIHLLNYCTVYLISLINMNIIFYQLI